MPTRDVLFRILGEDAASPAFNRAATSAEGAAARISRASDRMVATGRHLTHTFTLPILGIGAASVKAATDFNASMTRIQTQAGASARDVRILSRDVMAMKNVQYGPNQLATALYHLKSVGLDNVQAMKALRQAQDLAAVGGADLEETTNALAGAWRTGIRGAKDFHNAAATVNAIIGAGNMRLEDFNAALGTGILPTAKTFGLTLKDVGAALAVFTDESVPADAAATRLRMSMSLLGAPSKAAEKQLKKIGLSGIELANDMRKPNGLIVAIGDLKKHLEDPQYHLSLSRQAQLLSRAFGGGRSSSAILSLVNNFDVLKKKQDQVTASLGKYDHAVKVQQKTPEAQFKRDLADLERTGVVIGKDLLPLVVDGAHDVAKLAEGFDHLSSGQKGFIIEAGLALAALGPLMTVTGRLGGLFVSLGTKAKAAALFMAAPYRQTEEQAQIAALRTDYANAQIQADEALTAAAVARSEADKAAAAEAAAIRIAAAAEEQGTALQGVTTQAGLDAIEFNAAMQSEAAAAEAMAVKTAAAAEAAQLKLTTATAGMTRSVYGLQAAMAGVGIGLTIGTLDRNASTTTKLIGTLGSTAAGAAVGFSMGGPLGAAIGGLAGGLSSLVGWFHHTSDAADEAAKAAQAFLDQQNQAAQDLLGTLQAVNGAYGKTAKASVLGELQRSGVLLKAANLGINPRQLLTGVMGNAAELSRIESTIIKAMGGTGPETNALINQIDAIASGGRRAERTFELMQRALGKPLVPAKQLTGGLKNLSKELTGSTDLAVNVSKNNAQVFREYFHAVNGVQKYGDFTALGQRNVKVIEANIDHFRRLAAQELKSGDSLHKVRGDYANHLADLKAELIQMGFNKQQVGTLIGVYKNLPKNIITYIRAEDHATAKLKALQAYIHSHSWHVNVGVNASGDAVKYFPGYGLVTVHHPARGGYIAGPGTGTSDSIPAMISNGEYVINARQTAKHRQLLDAINAGAQGYASGGFVGPASAPSSYSRHRKFKVDGGKVMLTGPGGRQFEAYIQDLVLAELDFAAGDG